MEQTVTAITALVEEVEETTPQEMFEIAIRNDSKLSEEYKARKELLEQGKIMFQGEETLTEQDRITKKYLKNLLKDLRNLEEKFEEKKDMTLLFETVEKQIDLLTLIKGNNLKGKIEASAMLSFDLNPDKIIIKTIKNDIELSCITGVEEEITVSGKTMGFRGFLDKTKSDEICSFHFEGGQVFVLRNKFKWNSKSKSFKVLPIVHGALII